MKKPSIYQNRSQELLALFEQAGNSSKVMCVPIDYAKKDHLIMFCENLDKAKRGSRVMYWIDYRFKDPLSGKLTRRRESVDAMEGLKGNSIDDARTALSKRSVQKRENRVMDLLPESRMTFTQLTDWYLKLEKVKSLASYSIIKIRLAAFNAVFGTIPISDVKLSDLENYQMQRLKTGKAPATVDHEIKKMQTAIIKAFDDGMIGGDVLRVFKRFKPTLKKGSDIRDRILSPDEFDAIMDQLPQYMKPVFAMGCGGPQKLDNVLSSGSHPKRSFS